MVEKMSEALGLEALRVQSADALQPVSRMVRVFISSTYSGRACTDCFVHLPLETWKYSGIFN